MWFTKKNVVCVLAEYTIFNVHYIEDLKTLVHHIEDTCLENRRLENTYHLLIPIFSRVPHKASPILLGLLLLLYFISIFGTAQAHAKLMENLEDGGIKSKEWVYLLYLAKILA